MEMLKFVLFVGVSVSLIPGDAQLCCAPSQFQTFFDEMTSLSSERDKRFRTMMFSSDENSNKTAIHVIAQSEEDKYDRIDDYAAGKSYEWARGTCYVGRTQPNKQTCIPAEAKLVRRSFVGVSPNIVNVDTYMYTLGSGLVRYVTVGPNCTPVEVVVTTSKIPQPDGQFMWIFYNMTMGIKDPSIFTPPKICFKEGSRVNGQPDFKPYWWSML
ncbi:uncharacterized protein LOC125661959 [Ostrea edulis]|uniref:uncharacterized protein LOC125661959 n=1 Tax=Ostrea edulis TaxID=37623 RepID=UPI0020943F06|nr:uncharacterized protein LOC125661959 [Ostrea edulis]